MLKLFYAPGSCALASHVALEEAGAKYEAVRVDMRAKDQRKPEYLAINPKGRVPALVTDKGVLTESPAILAFVAQSFPEARLAPLDDAFAFARVQLQQLSLLHRARRPCSSKSRLSLGRRPAAAIAAMRKKAPQSIGDREMIYSIREAVACWSAVGGRPPQRLSCSRGSPAVPLQHLGRNAPAGCLRPPAGPADDHRQHGSVRQGLQCVALLISHKYT